MAQRALLTPQRRVPELGDRAQITEVLLHVRRRPPPRELVDVRDEPAHVAGPLLNRGELQVPRQLLVPPPLQHLLHDLRLRVQQRNRTHQVHPPDLVHRHPNHPPTGLIR